MKKEISIYVGKKIRQYRKMKGLTQKQLGEKVGVKHNTISSYENGTNEPEQNIMYSIANVLDVSINDFFPDTEEKRVVKESGPAYSIGSKLYPYFPANISAGLPISVEGITSSESINLPDNIMGKWAGSNVFITKVNGESMNRVIPHGSLIAVKYIEAAELKNGDIVVYSDNHEYSVKRFYRHDDKIIFRPDSTDLGFTDYVTSIENPNLQIHGKVVLYIVELD
ncbi:XRE family transcriptional regulator [Siminovitchia fortis]|uniref:XRE family transcriptional regulator n=1 Tax=Siminovitchia fortis TaxID=254758 RepID=A0A443IM19_9BACI|nr:XRE family transcriptional regulator [Siminovitchia fortis]RWR06705.1 XRE family transcriptional regulator [Siminovitchia fortis]WHY82970.1 XRE family transcriptional regulator [Siminovitchia fortis]